MKERAVRFQNLINTLGNIRLKEKESFHIITDFTEIRINENKDGFYKKDGKFIKANKIESILSEANADHEFELHEFKIVKDNSTFASLFKGSKYELIEVCRTYSVPMFYEDIINLIFKYNSDVSKVLFTVKYGTAYLSFEAYREVILRFYEKFVDKKSYVFINNWKTLKTQFEEMEIESITPIFSVENWRASIENFRVLNERKEFSFKKIDIIDESRRKNAKSDKE